MLLSRDVKLTANACATARGLAATMVWAVVCWSVAGCRVRPPVVSPPAPAPWDAHVERFTDDYFHANPTFAAFQGKHAFDGEFPDWSAAGLEAEIARLHRERDVTAAFDDAKLDARRRFQRGYVLAVIDRDLFWLEEARAPWKNPAYYGDALDPNLYVTRPYAPLATRLRALNRWLAHVPRALAQIRGTLQAPMPLPLAQIGKIRFGGLVSYLRDDVPPVFATVSEPALRAEFEAVRPAAIAAFAAMGQWFQALEATASGDFALGPEKFERMLWMTERVRLTVDAVLALGRADLARNRAALAEACARYAPGKSLLACMEAMNAHKPALDTVAAARAQLAGLRAFIVAKDLVTIPSEEQAEVRESPPYMRWNLAYIDPPGPFEHGLPAVYYVAPPDPSWSVKDQQEYLPSRADLLFTSVHEVWPGHFLQFLHANRSPDLFGRVFVGYAFAEGWAHYAEEMMWEAGLDDGAPETHIGQLSNALLRDARFLAAIEMHARGMSLAAAETLFRDEGLQPAATARQQAARGAFDPAYLNYTLGKLVMRQLREDWTLSHGGREGWKAFHDTLLSYGGPPLGLVRGAMLGP